MIPKFLFPKGGQLSKPSPFGPVVKFWLCGLSLIIIGIGVVHIFPQIAARLGAWVSVQELHLPPGTKVDAIIVLGGNTFARIERGIELYNSDVAPLLVLTGYSPEATSEDRDEILNARDYALRSGVPQSNFALLSTTSTIEDSKEIASYVLDHKLRRIVVVSDWTHGRRAVCSIKAALGQNPLTLYFVARPSNYDPSTWWVDKVGSREVLAEVAKMGIYRMLYGVPMGECFPGDAGVLSYLFLIALGLVTSITSVEFIRRNAVRLGRIDVPNERSSHTLPTPRGGGLGIIFAVVVPWLIAIWIWPRQTTVPLWMSVAFPCAAVLVATIGWFDDKRSVSPRLRLLLYFLVCSGFVVMAGTFNTIYFPILGEIPLAVLPAFGITVLWLVGFLNIFNFMDGIDGLAGCQALLAAIFWLILFLIEGQAGLAFLSSLLAAGCLGFLFLNLPPARIFMGDVGSAFLGFSLAALPIMAYTQTNNPRTLVVGVFFVLPFVFDGTLTIIRRALRRENIFEPHRSHLYQQLVIAGQTHRQVTAKYCLLMLLSGVCGLIFYTGDQTEVLLSICFMLCIFASFSIYVSVVNLRIRNKLGQTS